MLIAATLLLSSWVSAPAAQIYKCRMPNGVLSFQAKPCPRGTHLKTLVVPNSNPAPPKAAPAVAAATATPLAGPANTAEPAAASAASVPPPTPPAASALPLAAYYRCLRHDGSSYYSASAFPRRERIGVGALSDPALAKTPAEAGKVWVEDQCSEVSLKEACDWYEQQSAYVAAQQRVNSGLELKKLVQEYQRLSTIRSARCRS